MNLQTSLKQWDIDFVKSLIDQEPNAQKVLLLSIVNKFHPVSTHHSGTVFGKISEAEIETLMDFLGDALAIKGFGSDYEPNTLGQKVEDLIDKISEQHE